MSQTPRPLVAGNWKMNGLKAALGELALIRDAVAAGAAGKAEIGICPPFTLVGAAVEAAGGKVAIGGQDCHAKVNGAHTGDIAAEMLADLGATYVIVGHSERRTDHAESDAVVKAKAEAGLRANLNVIICVGETKDQRVAGEALAVVGGQLAGSVPANAPAERIVIAYEPVWAIGTGLTPTAKDVEEVHAFIRAELVKVFGAAGNGVRILYGGSVKPSNAVELMGVANVNGALVGGASLKCADFQGIFSVYK